MLGGSVKNTDDIGNNISKQIIEYDNKDNLSLKEVFNSFWEKYKNNDLDLDEDKVLIKVIYYLSKYGYDIISTHPFKIKKYK